MVKSRHLEQLKQGLPIKADSSGFDLGGSYSESTSKKFRMSMMVPIPENQDPLWTIKQLDSKNSGKFWKQVNRTLFSDYDISTLRYEALTKPVATLPKIVALLEKHPKDPELHIIWAICSEGTLPQEGNEDMQIYSRQKVVRSLAIGLSNGAFSLYNLQHFIISYFTYVAHLNVTQTRVKNVVLRSSNDKNDKDLIIKKVRELKLLLQDREKLAKTLSFILQNQNLSIYVNNIDFNYLDKACALIKNGAPFKDCGMGSAKRVVSVFFLLGTIFGRIPLLKELFDEIYDRIPDDTLTLRLRKNSLKSTSDLMRLKIAIIRNEKATVASLAKNIFDENLKIAEETKLKVYREPYEVISFFNLPIITEMAHKFLPSAEVDRMIERSVFFMDNVSVLNFDKINSFKTVAKKHLMKLLLMKEK